MTTSSLGLINYGLILIFGVYLTFGFAGVESNYENNKSRLKFICLSISLQVISNYFLGLDTTKKIYPLIVHMPLVIFLKIRFKSSWTIAFVSMLSAYLCCQIPRWFATLALYVFNTRESYYVFNTLAIYPTFYLLKRYVIYSINQLMNISKNSLTLFGMVPLMYYIFDYVTTVYTDLLYRGIEVAVQFMPSFVSMFYFIFAIIYFSEMKKRSTAEQERIIMNVQIDQAKKELNAFSELQEKTAIYRHDMRHHLSLISGYITDGDSQKALEYIHSTQSDIEEITPNRYCENYAINLIFSSFTSKAKSKSISLFVDAVIPQNIVFPETELCSLFSNGLENAIIAASKINDGSLRKVHVNCKIHKGKLLILIENSYEGNLIFKEGMPKSKRTGHGFGTKSIAMITEKNNGYYSFEAKDGIFTLRVVLPLQKL